MSNTIQPDQDGVQSDKSSFDEEYSIFTRPLKDLPLLDSMQLIFNVDEQYKQTQHTNHQNEESDEENAQDQRTPFEWLMSLQNKNMFSSQPHVGREETKETGGGINHYLDIDDDVNTFSREDLNKYEGEPDFMVSSAHLKELLSAPYNNEKSLSLKVSKQGETLQINKMHPLTANTKGARKHFKDDREFVSKIEQIHEKQVELYQQSLIPRNQGSSVAVPRNNFSLSSDESSSADIFSGLCQTSNHSVNSLYEKMNQKGLMREDHFFRKDYGRVLELKLGKFKMLIGSNLLIFYKDSLYPISLKLLQAERKLNPLSCLDMWLDNVMHNVEESAICYHKNGVVQEYKLVKTEEMFQNQDQKLFDPSVVKANALNILEFIKKSCIKEGGTYWIFKDQEKNQIQLYDLSSEEEEMTKSDEQPIVTEPRGSTAVALQTQLATLIGGEEGRVQPVLRKHACSFNQASHNSSPIMSPIEFCMSTALTCMYVKTAVKIGEQKSDNGLRKLQLYLVGKARIFLNQSTTQTSEIIKSALASILRVVNQDKWTEIDQDDMRTIEECSIQFLQAANQRQRDILLEKQEALEKRISKLQLEIQEAQMQPLPNKSYDFARTLCHFNRCGQHSQEAEIDFFKMIQDVDLNDLKNQYLDNIERHKLRKESVDRSILIESLHILYHIFMLKQEPLKALTYSLQLESLLNAIQDKREEHFLETICVTSIIGFNYIKYSQQDLPEVQSEENSSELILKPFLQTYSQKDRIIPMLEVATRYYGKTADAIRNQAGESAVQNSRDQLFKQLLNEEVLLMYKICKIKGIQYTKMLQYFELVIEKLGSMKNYELMLKITIDLIETFKFKVNEINPTPHQFTYVSKVNTLLNEIRKQCKALSLCSQLTYHQAKLNLALSLLLQQQQSPQTITLVRDLFAKSIKQLSSLPQTEETQLDQAAANYHFGKYLVENGEGSQELVLASLWKAIGYFKLKDKPIDALRGLNQVLSVNGQGKQEIIQLLRATREMLEIMRKQRKDLKSGQADRQLILQKIDTILDQTHSQVLKFLDFIDNEGFKKHYKDILTKQQRSTEELISLVLKTF